ncbi:O-methylsterigmatocystin oxidoreductase [Termitomyces sp. T112]|nr:O-methylsterigmatocystin oxidoreductase [Termitomyces sp. T112]
MSLSLLFYVALAVSTSLLIKWWYAPSSRPPYPPGPPTKLLSGNFGELPTTLPWLKYTDWAKQYGGLVHLRAYNDHVVVVNTVEDAVAMLEKRSCVYSDRPRLTMVKLMGWDFNVGLEGYGDKWRRHRKLYQQTLNKAIIQQTQEPTQTLKVHEYLSRLLVAPNDFLHHFRNMTAAMIISTVYDNTMSQSTIERFADISEATMTKLSEALFPGAFAVDTLPFLRYIPAWFPGAGFQRYAAECRVLTDEMQDRPLKYVKEQIDAGRQISSLVATLLERKSDASESLHEETDIKMVAATIFAAGADTSVSALSTFMYAMVVNVDAQKKAQVELDAVVGASRLPDFSDRPNLPYLEALFREVMRWHPVLPLGVSHAALKDDIYNGYFIPKGTTVISNIWAMTHDEKKYPQPDLFLPERFLDRDGKLNKDDTILGFGFGRRICPGRHMASSTVWLVIAATLATFDIRKAKDERGNEIPVDGDYSDGLVSHKHPFLCSITPRSEVARELILDAQSRQD